MHKIALLGAGGKMGFRLARNLRGTPYAVSHVEVSAEGRARLERELGIRCVPREQALADADFLVLAVPDARIGTVLRECVAELRPGTLVVILDAAAPWAGELPQRPDIGYFVTHPCHPPLFRQEASEAAQRDFFGGEAAAQAIVCALAQGPEEVYARGEELARCMFRPVSRAHRVAVEHMAILEPALSETVGATLVTALREATEEAIRRGVPRAAAMDFMLGHLSIELAILFEVFPGRFSDGALLAIETAKRTIFREGWLERVFAPEAVKESVVEICRAQQGAPS